MAPRRIRDAVPLQVRVLERTESGYKLIRKLAAIFAFRKRVG